MDQILGLSCIIRWDTVVDSLWNDKKVLWSGIQKLVLWNTKELKWSRRKVRFISHDNGMSNREDVEVNWNSRRMESVSGCNYSCRSTGPGHEERCSCTGIMSRWCRAAQARVPGLPLFRLKFIPMVNTDSKIKIKIIFLSNKIVVPFTHHYRILKNMQPYTK